MFYNSSSFISNRSVMPKKRRSPRRHTVNLRHPRFKQTTYTRGVPILGPSSVSSKRTIVHLDGHYYLDLNSGECYYAPAGYKIPLGHIKGTNLYRRVRATYGTRDGAKARRDLAKAIIGRGGGEGKKINL